jgi:hypothetical protein
VGGVSVYIDGAYAGRTEDGWNVTSHTLTIPIETGDRFIELRRDGFNTIQFPRFFPPGDTRPVPLRFILHPM